MSTPPYITPAQAKWFETVREGLEADTGKSLDAWIETAKTCPETKHKARLSWFKREHGLGINRASVILGAAFKTGLGWDKPDALLDHVWKQPEQRQIYETIAVMVSGFGDDVTVGPRKSFSGFSRRYQFAAARPTRAGVRLGLAVPLDQARGCEAPKSSDSWSDRLTAVTVLTCAEDMDETLEALLRQAYETS